MGRNVNDMRPQPQQAARLTDAELAVLVLTGNLWNAIHALGNHHPADMDEYRRDIHSIQQRLMARLARRAHPDVFI